MHVSQVTVAVSWIIECHSITELKELAFFVCDVASQISTDEAAPSRRRDEGLKSFPDRGGYVSIGEVRLNGFDRTAGYFLDHVGCHRATLDYGLWQLCNGGHCSH